MEETTIRALTVRDAQTLMTWDDTFRDLHHDLKRCRDRAAEMGPMVAHIEGRLNFIQRLLRIAANECRDVVYADEDGKHTLRPQFKGD
jgi:hypothetical protein